MMINGSCLCGAVRWQYDGSFERMAHCHCGMCRKAHGSAFATYAVGPAAPFAYLSGSEKRISRESSKGFVRSFCETCGSVLPNTDLGDIVAIPAGLFDDSPGLEASAHIFTKWKAPWHTISDALPQHDNYPGVADPAVDTATTSASGDGALRGSCLCGAIAFEVQAEFKVVHNCHCSRCRKSRGAAYATNGVLSDTAVRFTRGANKLKECKAPGAKFYTQTFCGECGSPMPRLDSSRSIAIVPLGALDDDPKRGADDHIFVGSKSAWVPITDDLPQFTEMAT
jgi:hypothetical protein